MGLTLAPSGTIKVAAGASVVLGAGGTVNAASVPQRAIQWATLTGVTAGGSQVCKTATNGYGNAVAISSDYLTAGQVGAFQVDAPLTRHRIAWASDGQNLRFGFEFTPSNGKVNVLVNGQVVKDAPVSSGQACRIEIFNRKVTWKVNNQIVHSLDNAATECSYKVRAELNEQNGCLLGLKFSASALAGSNISPSCFTWNVTGGTIAAAGANATYTAPIVPGTYFLTVSAPGAGEFMATIEVGNLAFSGNACGGKVVEGTIVEFQANGGEQATLEADGGVVIDSTHWLAPSLPGVYHLVYKINGQESSCVVEVVRKLRIEGVVNDEFPNVIPNQQIVFQANCDDVRYSSPDCPECINVLGFFVAPDYTASDSFGEAEIEIVAEGCGQQVTFSVVIDPVYPSEQFGGATPTKTLPVMEKYNVTKLVSEGGSPSYYDDGAAPERVWKLSYKELYLCPVGDIPEGFRLNCPPQPTNILQLQHVQRLDKFHRLVRGIARPFTYIESDNGNVWRKCHFNKEMTRDHKDWYTQQSREVEIVWNGSCEEEANNSRC